MSKGLANDRGTVYSSLQGKVVVVTGGASGIGAAISGAFAGQNAQVAIFDVQTELGLGFAADLERSTGSPVMYSQVDVTDIDAVQTALERVTDQLGPPTVLVNNAASDARQAFSQVSSADWDQSMALNLKSQFFASQAVARGMADAGGGSIINIGSISWRIKGADVAAYQAAKAGIEGLTRALARDLGDLNIRVNCVAPGMTKTERQAKLWAGTSKFDDYIERQCLKRTLMPDDVARAILWFASEDSSMVTAQTLIVDAGAS